ncbi:MAG: hypothetical protein JXR78_04220 [Victivallales bacterium]|nr:hypothetical protein [Victivallales bacterium]
MRKMFLAYIATIALAGSVWSETGKICREYWIEHSGRLNGVKRNIAKAKAPTGRDTLVSFETVCWKNSKKKKNWGNKYAQRVFGFLIPEESGEYIFWIASDDSSELMLSSDDSPANAKRIARVDSWTPQRKWNKYPVQKSQTIRLEAGKKYYIEAIMYEGSGGDNLAVAWAKNADEAKPEIIKGQFLSTVSEGTPSAYAKNK